ncbi:hypothetical protein ACG33_00685 [Steroidobacter denitrificans]|uniref:Uncharacterized protein n=1 Tax=Steroidobacter denitrificans TaxID=465721 RepID=A0A127F5D8_STEDE|nr:hypothetical protein [Steroidobacter denitrificans]AMN45643.1 hypothetical protein ACG33_00685 [Steroidobacter denitrificans]
MSSTPNLFSNTPVVSAAGVQAGAVAGVTVSRRVSRSQQASAAHTTGILPEAARGHCAASQQTPAAAEDEANFVQTGGWSAYEVWFRFIKEAREKRRPPG